VNELLQRTVAALDRRSLVSTALLFIAFAASLFFHGTGANLVVLVASSACLLASMSVLGARGSEDGVGLGIPTALGALAVLAINYQWSQSKDSSYAPTWVLAALPLAFVVAQRLEAAARATLRRACTALVAALACVSLARFVALGERAHLPLVDPNNYAALIYLVWIPFVHERIARGWRGDGSTRLARTIEVLASFAMLAALFATRSRAGSAIVAVAIAVWIGLALVRRLGLSRPLTHAGVAVIALAFVLVASPPMSVQGGVASLGMGGAIRLDLDTAALRMFLDHPLTGVGVFCFPLLYGAYRSPAEQLTAGLFVHNDYVQLLAEGGVLLLAFALVIACAAVVATLRGVRAPIDSKAFASLGTALAIGAACAHATINFVLYALPLATLLGILLGDVVERSRGPTRVERPGALRIAIVASIAGGWLAWGYLALDLFTIGVFQGQPGVPFSAAVRSDPAAQLRYARAAQTLNEDRGIPVLAEAALLAQSALRPNAPGYLRERTLAKYREAIAVDPWNTLTYALMFDYVARLGPDVALADDERADALLLRALALDPVYAPAIDRLLALYDREGRSDRALALLKNVVFPWMELLKRRDADVAERYLEEMVRIARATGDAEFEAAAVAKRAALADVKPTEATSWFQ